MPEWQELPLTNPVGGKSLWINKEFGGPRREDRERRTREHNQVRELTAIMPLGYTFNADNYCAGCILFVVGGPVRNKPLVYATLREWGAAKKINMDDETSYDSDTWPKAIYECQIEAPEFCGRCCCVFGADPDKFNWCESCNGFWVNCRCREET